MLRLQEGFARRVHPVFRQTSINDCIEREAL